MKEKIKLYLLILVVCSLGSLLAFPFGIDWYIAEIISIVQSILITFISVYIETVAQIVKRNKK